MQDETERLLTSLIPTSSLDRDEVMFRAGRASARGWVWPLATLVSTSAAAVLAVVLARGGATRAPDPREDTAGSRPAARPIENPSAPEEPAPLIAARRLEQQVLLHGLEGLGPAAPLPPAPDFPGDI